MRKRPVFLSLLLILSFAFMIISPAALTAPAAAVQMVIPGQGSGITLIFTAEKLEVTPAAQSVPIGETAAYKCTAYNAAGDSRDYTDMVQWHIGVETIADNLGKGEFMGVTAGETQVYAVLDKLWSNHSFLTVTPAGEPRLVIEPITAEINAGDTQQYRAYLRNTLSDSPNTDVTDECEWSISNPIADLTGPGLFKGTDPGYATITAHYVKTSTAVILYLPPIDLTAQARLTVNEADTRYWLEVVPQAATITVGEKQQYKALLHNSGSDSPLDVTNKCTWSIYDNIAEITGKGLFKGLVEGSTTVKAVYSLAENPSEDVIYLRKIDAEVDIVPPETLSDTAKLTVMDQPPTENLPEGKMIDRQPGYITLSAPVNLGEPGNEFYLDFDGGLMDGNKDRHPKVFYWNDSYDKWVALASYPVTADRVRAVNDGNYSGWFVVMGCIQPTFTDISGHWAENTANRMNGLGLLEGYPDPADPDSLTRPSGLERVIIRSELTAAVARILGLSPGDTHLFPTITYMSAGENDQVLNGKYTDAGEIPDWARPYIASMTKAGLVSGKGDRFAPDDQMTRIEAAIMISNALRDVPGFGTPADLGTYTDSAEVPEWAVGKVAQGTINGYPDGSLRPNQPIKRSEALTLLLTLLKGLYW